MRVYFTSSVPCALKLNGIFLGVCDDREKFTDITPEEEIFAEFVPADGGLLSANCILNKSFFQSPPDFCDLYLYDCGAHIHIREFSEKPGNLNVIDQKRINGVLVTLFHNGGIHLSLESEKDFFTEQLPPQARYAEISSLTLNDRNLISLVIPEEADSILLIYDKTRPLFKNRVSKFEIKDTLCADFAFRDTAGHIAHSEWKLGEEGFTLDSYTVQETNQVNHVIDPVGLLDIKEFKTIALRPKIDKPYAVMYLADIFLLCRKKNFFCPLTVYWKCRKCIKVSI